MSVPLSFSYYAHIPMVNLPGGIFVRGASDMTLNPPTWREVSPFSVSLSHVTEHEFLDVMDKSSEHESLLQEIRDRYQSVWKRPLQPSAHPMTCVSWHDAKKFCEILSKGRLTGMAPLSLPTEDQMEYAMRGPPVNLRHAMEDEGISIKDFGAWATDRFENFVTRLEMGARILRDPKGKALRKILEGKLEVYAWRMYGTPNGRLFEKKADGTIVKNAWYGDDKGGRKDRTREVKRIWGDGDPQGTVTANDLINSGEAHPFGLTDASGNVWSWCEDEDVILFRRLRGGGWNNGFPNGLFAARLGSARPAVYNFEVGFRVAAAPHQSRSPY